MIRTLALGALTAALLAATSASAQMYPGQSVSVNGQSGAYGPRGPYPGVIHLHMPATHRHKARKAKAAEPSAADVSSALLAAQPAATPAPDKSVPPPKAPSEATPAPEPATGSVMDGGIPLSLSPGERHPIATPKPQKAKTTASIAPAATSTAGAAQQAPKNNRNLAKRSEILFPRGATDLGTATINSLHSIAADLNAALAGGAARVQLNAYGGAPGDKSSDARRLSLKRALVIRQILIEDGVPSERIDVRAMGGIDDHGAPDRVDVFVNAG